MKGQFITILLFWSMGNISIAQLPDWQWAKNPIIADTVLSYIADNAGYSVNTDANGNVYVTGVFGNPTITFGNYTLTNAGDSADIFVVKYDPTGKVMWATRAGGLGADIGYNISTDLNGNVYLTGYFSSNAIIFGTDTLINNAISGNNAFVAKYDSSGNIKWAKSFGNNGNTYGYSVNADNIGNVYVTGGFSNTVIFGSDTLKDTSDPLTDIFVIKYDSSGSEIWGKGFSGSRDGKKYQFNDYGDGICSDGIGNIYLAGYFTDSIFIFGNDTLVNTSVGAMFVLKLNPLGNITWANGGIGITASSALVNNIGLDMNANVYVNGSFNGTVFFGSDSVTSVYDYVANYGNMFLVKYDSSGNKIWVKGAEGNEYFGTTDINGNSYLTGQDNYSIILGNDTLMDYFGDETFIVKFDSSGSIVWVKSIGATTIQGDIQSNGICSDGNGNVYITGFIVGDTIPFGTDTISVPANNENIFTAKLSNTTTGIASIATPTQHLTIYPNPAQNQATIEWQPNGEPAGYVTIYDLLGRQISDQQVDGTSGQALLNTTTLNDGLYVVKLNFGNGEVMSGKLAVGR